jgi:hypothetical protein
MVTQLMDIRGGFSRAEQHIQNAMDHQFGASHAVCLKRQL